MDQIHPHPQHREEPVRDADDDEELEHREFVVPASVRAALLEPSSPPRPGPRGFLFCPAIVANAVSAKSCASERARIGGWFGQRIVRRGRTTMDRGNTTRGAGRAIRPSARARARRGRTHCTAMRRNFGELIAVGSMSPPLMVWCSTKRV